MDVIIGIDALNKLPTDGTKLDQLRSYGENDDIHDETENDMGGNELEPEQVNETREAASD